MSINFSVPCLFGLEGLCADELRRLRMEDVKAENGRVLFTGNLVDIARANIALRTGERVLLIIGETKAHSFDELFEGVRAMDWDNYITIDGAFPVKGYSLNSQLHSIPDCQSIIKKAIAEQLKSKYKLEWFQETGAKFQVQFAIRDDIATLYIDTSGAGLHKRGYRPSSNVAPLRETLAAAIVTLSRYKGKQQVCDPFCGSGTIAIEAALMALNRAPGLNRNFAAMHWDWLEQELWESSKSEAKDREYTGDYEIWGGDIDEKSIEIAIENGKRAGVSDIVRFETADATKFQRDLSGGIIMTNPPYGMRVSDKKEAEALYRAFGSAVEKLEGWNMYILSSHTEFERNFGKTATKKRKLYNGMIKCDLFMYF
ncbi:MAG: class I SAM-dependent RNA methyltransferase [Oscillospiraceae bacterium]|nr:class I SAM-dependent RNA methyltransferase [Oscillospiraceae bacterium]